MAVWSYRVCERDGSNLDEINLAKSRTLSLPINGLPTASFTIRTDDLAAERVLALAGQLLKVYRNNALLFCGPVVSAEESSQEGYGQITANAAGVFWRLGKRLLGRVWDGHGRGVGWSWGTPLAMVDRSQILAAILNTVNGEYDTGIRLGTVQDMGANAFAGPYHFKPAGEAFVEIAATFDGPDWEVVPSEPTVDGAGVKLGTMNIKPEILVDRRVGNPNAAIFEYATGLRNVKSYQRPRSLDGLANETWALPAGYPDSHPEGQAPHGEGDAAIRAIHGMAAAVVSEDLITDQFRIAIAKEHLRIRKQAREIVTFTLVRNPQPDYGDFAVGDLVTARAVEAGVTRFDAGFRVYGVGFNVDEEGNEDMTLTLVPQA